MFEYEMIFTDGSKDYIDDCRVTMPEYFSIWEVGIHMLQHFPKAKEVLINRIDDYGVVESMIIKEA